MKLSLKTALALAPMMLGVIAPAKANLLIQYSLSVGSYNSGLVTLASGPSGTAVVGGVTNNHGLTLTLLDATSNSPGTGTTGYVEGSSVAVAYVGNGAATVKIFIGDTGFTAPVTPPGPGITFYSEIGGSILSGSASDTLAYRSCLSSTNAQNACPGTLSTQFVNQVITTPAPGQSTSFDDTDSTLVTALSGTYSVTEEVDLHLVGGVHFNFATNSDLDPVPEPASLFLLGASLVGLGVMRRRRKAV